MIVLFHFQHIPHRCVFIYMVPFMVPCDWYIPKVRLDFACSTFIYLPSSHPGMLAVASFTIFTSVTWQNKSEKLLQYAAFLPSTDTLHIYEIWLMPFYLGTIFAPVHCIYVLFVMRDPMIFRGVSHLRWRLDACSRRSTCRKKNVPFI